MWSLSKANGQRSRVMKHFDEAGAVSLLLDAVRIYSPTGREGAVSRFFSEAMKSHGFRRVRTDSAGNAIGDSGRGRIRVLLSGHMDTVPGRIPVLYRDGRLSGRGSVDAKSPMCAMLVSASRFIDDPDLLLTVACTTGEEADSVGIRTVMKNGPGYDFAVFGEPGGSGRVTVGYRGRMTLQVSLKTEGGHAGSSWAHRNAFDEASDLVALLRDYGHVGNGGGDHYRSHSISPTLFEAGEYHNVVPGHARFTCDVRIPPKSDCEAVKKDLEALIDDFSRSKGIKVGHQFGDQTDPYEVPVSSLLVRAFQRGIILKIGSRPVLLRKTGTGDMNTFASVKKVECVTYGPGDAGLSHTSRESVGVDDYLQSIEVMTEALRQIKQLSFWKPNV